MKEDTKSHDVYMCIVNNPMTSREIAEEIGESVSFVVQYMHYLRSNDVIIYKTGKKYWCKPHEFKKSGQSILLSALFEREGSWVPVGYIVETTDLCNANHVYKSALRLIRDGVAIKMDRRGPRKSRRYKLEKEGPKKQTRYAYANSNGHMSRNYESKEELNRMFSASHGYQLIKFEIEVE